MNILLIGKGGREHALAFKLSRSPLLTKLYLWPGNPAMAGLGEPLDLAPDSSFDRLIEVIQHHKIDGVVSGPEGPLAEGLADKLADVGIPTFGPVQKVAALESSKQFAKEVMRDAGIPTADYKVANNEGECKAIATTMLQSTGGVVLKASGLAGGKGVFVCNDMEQVDNGLRHLYHSGMQQAAKSVVVEEVLKGRECSYFSFLGKGSSTPIGFAVDFKRLKDGDEGPNTGGMGCYTPVPWLPENASQILESNVVEPLMGELAKRGLEYCGFIYVGVMWSDSGPKVIEFNVRMGDPEAQVLAANDDRDWLKLIAAKMGLASDESFDVNHTDQKAVVVTMASASYPYGEGEDKAVSIAPKIFAPNLLQAFGASVGGQPDAMTTGSGRVLSVIGRGPSFAEARKQAYERVDSLTWPGAQWRKDIGKRIAEESI